jgi:hypothetical protein
MALYDEKEWDRLALKIKAKVDAKKLSPELAAECALIPSSKLKSYTEADFDRWLSFIGRKEIDIYVDGDTVTSLRKILRDATGNVKEDSAVSGKEVVDQLKVLTKQYDQIMAAVQPKRGVKRKITLSDESGTESAMKEFKVRLGMIENNSDLLEKLAVTDILSAYKWLEAQSSNNSVRQVGEATQKEDYITYLSELSGLPVYDEKNHDEFCSRYQHSKDVQFCLKLGDRGQGATKAVATDELPIGVSGQPDVLIVPISAIRARAVNANVACYLDVKKPGRMCVSQSKVTLLGGNCNSEQLPIAIHTDLTKECHLFWFSKNSSGTLVLNQSSLVGDKVPGTIRKLLRDLAARTLLHNERVNLRSAVHLSEIAPVLDDRKKTAKKSKPAENKAGESKNDKTQVSLVAHAPEDPRFAHLQPAQLDPDQHKESLQSVMRTLFLRLPSVRQEVLPRSFYDFYG